MPRIAPQGSDRIIDMPETTIGERIKKRRTATGLSPQQLAAEIGKVRPTIVQYEAGKILPPIDVLEQISAALKISPAYLAFGSVNETDRQSKPDYVPIPLGLNTDEHPDKTMDIIIPIQSVEDFGWPSQSLQAVKLGIGAPHLGLEARDLLIIEADCQNVLADGRVYAFESLGGVMVMRSEALPDGCDDAVVLTGPHGQTLNFGKPPKTIGRVVGQIHTLCRP